MSLFYDRQGNPIDDTLKWGRLFESEDRTVGQDQIGEVFVSTVWLGINHNVRPEGPPLIFETMIFGGPHDREMWRYSTEAQAVEGHKRALKLVREGAEE